LGEGREKEKEKGEGGRRTKKEGKGGKRREKEEEGGRRSGSQTNHLTSSTLPNGALLQLPTVHQRLHPLIGLGRKEKGKGGRGRERKKGKGRRRRGSPTNYPVQLSPMVLYYNCRQYTKDFIL
jgi:hypothetical protein